VARGEQAAQIVRLIPETAQGASTSRRCRSDGAPVLFPRALTVTVDDP